MKRVTAPRKPGFIVSKHRATFTSDKVFTPRELVYNEGSLLYRNLPYIGDDAGNGGAKGDGYADGSSTARCSCWCCYALIAGLALCTVQYSLGLSKIVGPWFDFPFDEIFLRTFSNPVAAFGEEDFNVTVTGSGLSRK